MNWDERTQHYVAEFDYAGGFGSSHQVLTVFLRQLFAFLGPPGTPYNP